jgi:hypothetical protein
VGPSFTLLGKDISSAIVYVWKRKDIYLYVGMSKVGLSRPFGNHHIINKLDTIQPDDTFEIYYTEHPLALEEYLIKIHKPKLNLNHNSRNSYAKGKHREFDRKEYLRKLDKEIKTKEIKDKIAKMKANAARIINLIEAKKRLKERQAS